jgi:phosphoribosylformylglycinamidine cyclo-ligase
MKPKTITYAQVGDNYDTKDPIKILAQAAAAGTAVNLTKHGFEELPDSRGESAYVWRLGKTLMASVVEGLGTKNLVADAMRNVTGKTYYDCIAHDTVATIINDLVSVGATPLILHAYWAIEDNDWLHDTERMTDFIDGWKNACDEAQVSWGGGETPTLKGIIKPQTVELGGAAMGIIKPQKYYLCDQKIKVGDSILLMKSNGINANGLSLARAIAAKLPDGYATKLDSGNRYGEALLTKTNIYAKLIQVLLHEGVELHYISNITGHGLRKIMRGRPAYTYVLEQIDEPQEVFAFIQQHAKLSDFEMYQTFNMGMDYALFMPEKEIERAQRIIEEQGYGSIMAGRVERGKKQVVIKSKGIVYGEETLRVR